MNANSMQHQADAHPPSGVAVAASASGAAIQMRGALAGLGYEQQAQMLRPIQRKGSAAVQRDGSGQAPDKAPEVDVAPPQTEDKTASTGPMAADAALKVLEDAFGGYKKMVQGSVQVLSADDFKAAWEKVYAGTKYAWDPYVLAKPGKTLNGFAYGGVNYINKSEANLGTVPHEMLHSNTAADWTGVVGSEFNEGSTDYLKQFALKKAGKTAPNSYASQMGVVTTYVGIASESDLFTAYLKGDAATLVKAKVDSACGSWSDVKDAMQAKDFAKAKLKLKKKA